MPGVRPEGLAGGRVRDESVTAPMPNCVHEPQGRGKGDGLSLHMVTELVCLHDLILVFKNSVTASHGKAGIQMPAFSCHLRPHHGKPHKPRRWETARTQVGEQVTGM